MFVHDVKSLERQWGSFNREPFTFSKVESLCRRMRIKLDPDRSISKAAAFIHKGKRYILYNPYQTDTYLLLNIGHEIGHFSLGHIKKNDPHLYSNPFEVRKMRERYAGIIGFLMWLPSSEVCKMMHDGVLDIDEMYKFVRWNDPDLTYQEALKLCTSRISIFNAYRRRILKCRIGRQMSFASVHIQKMLPLNNFIENLG